MNTTALTTFQILQHLTVRSFVSTQELMDKFEISKATVKNHIATLRALGFEVESIMGRHGGYQLSRRTISLRAPLSETEQDSLLQARAHLTGTNFVHMEQFELAVSKLILHSTGEGTLVHDAQVVNWVSTQAVRERVLYDKLNGAYHRRNRVRLYYKAHSTNETTERVVQPYGFLHYKGKYYMVAHCDLRNGIRDFKLSRILECEEMNYTYTIPPSFDLQGYASDPYGIFKDGTVQAELIIKEPFATIVKEQPVSKDQETEQVNPNEIRLTCSLNGVTEVIGWLLSMGSSVQVIGSPELKKAYDEELQKMIENHKAKK